MPQITASPAAADIQPLRMRYYKLVAVVEIGAKRQVADSAAVAHDQIGARLAAGLVSETPSTQPLI
jgi:hypothetical protein